MQLIDTHAHLCFEAFDSDREEMMTRAYQAGIVKVVHPCCNLPEAQSIIDFANEFDGKDKVNVFCAVGVHPCELETWNEDSEDFINKFLTINYVGKLDSKIKAIGETGLDFYHCKQEAEQIRQREIFEVQIKIAKKYNLPLIIHTRDAWDATLEILQKHFQNSSSINPGVIHCFTGDNDFAQECIKLGFYISWSGVITYKKNDHFRAFAKGLDINRILVETDSPYLAPQAHRGKRNEPSFVTFMAEELAKCYGISVNELAKISTENAERLFKI